MDEMITPRKAPSRKECEAHIRKILAKEVLLEEGRNHHFKTAADFMKYFESLYPAGSALTKQVQRAVKSMNMPKDENGYFIINKTQEQLDQEQELKRVLSRTNAEVVSADVPLETVFLRADANYRSYLLQLFAESDTFRGKYVSIFEGSDGLLFLTENGSQLKTLLTSLLAQ